MDKPLPCPYCGEPEQIFVHPMETRAGVLRFVTCIVCDCRGPYDHTPEEAIAAWNRRAPWTVTMRHAELAAAMLFQMPGDGDEGLTAMVEALGGKVEG